MAAVQNSAESGWGTVKNHVTFTLLLPKKALSRKVSDTGVSHTQKEISGRDRRILPHDLAPATRLLEKLETERENTLLSSRRKFKFIRYLLC